MTLLTETRERFLLAITAKVPAERIAEIHFFQPLKQGGVESGVAVAAAWPETIVTEPAVPAESSEAVDATEMIEATEPIEAIEATEATEAIESSETVETDETVEPTNPEDLVAAHAEDSEGPASVPPSRHVVYMASYRHTLKGIDRGKWETIVVAEADAPLITVDAVVRGVQRRAGDVDDPTRMDGDEVREFVGARRPPTAPPTPVTAR